MQRKREIRGSSIDKYNKNPILDTCIYEFQFPDGHSEEFTVNSIAECLYSKIDSEVRQYLLLKELVDWHTISDAVDEAHEYQISFKNNIHKWHTTKIWELCILWKDGSTYWEELKDLKEAFPLQVAEFAIARGLKVELPSNGESHSY
jgi:hypothetical protein